MLLIQMLYNFEYSYKNTCNNFRIIAVNHFIQENTIQVEVNVEYKFHRYFFTKGAEIINRIIDDCNGVSIIFPKLASNDVVVIKGDAFNAEKAKRQIEQIVKDLVSITQISSSSNN